MKIHHWLLTCMFIYPSLAVSADGSAQPVTEQQVLRLTEIYVTQIISGKPPKALGGNFRAVIGANGQLKEITHSK